MFRVASILFNPSPILVNLLHVTAQAWGLPPDKAARRFSAKALQLQWAY